MAYRIIGGKKLEPAKKVLTKAFTKIKGDNTNILTWWPTEELCYCRKSGLLPYKVFEYVI